MARGTSSGNKLRRKLGVRSSSPDLATGRANHAASRSKRPRDAGTCIPAHVKIMIIPACKNMACRLRAPSLTTLPRTSDMTTNIPTCAKTACTSTMHNDKAAPAPMRPDCQAAGSVAPAASTPLSCLASIPRQTSKALGNARAAPADDMAKAAGAANSRPAAASLGLRPSPASATPSAPGSEAGPCGEAGREAMRPGRRVGSPPHAASARAWAPSHHPAIVRLAFGSSLAARCAACAPAAWSKHAVEAKAARRKRRGPRAAARDDDACWDTTVPTFASIAAEGGGSAPRRHMVAQGGGFAEGARTKIGWRLRDGASVSGP